MSSAGQIVGGAIGATVGFFTPVGPVVGAQIGISLGGIIDPPKGPRLTGPRLSDLSVQGAAYGSPIPRLYGSVAVAGTVVWLENDRLKEVSTKSEQGGKGGPVSETTTFSYYATFALVLCSGPISGVRRIWAGANLIYDAGSGDIETIIASNALAENFRVHLGTADQMPDERMQATLGTDCPAWRGIAYIVFDDFALADYSNNLAATQFKVEVVSVGSASPVATEIGDAVLTEDAPFATWRYDDGVLRAMRMGRYSATSGWVDGYYEEIYRLDMTRVKSSLLPTQSGYGEGQYQVIGSTNEYFVNEGFAPTHMVHFGTDGRSFTAPWQLETPPYLDLVWRVDGVAKHGDVYYAVPQSPLSSLTIDLYGFNAALLHENHDYKTPAYTSTVKLRTHADGDYIVMHSNIKRISDDGDVSAVVLDTDLNVIHEVAAGVVSELIGVYGNTVCYVDGAGFKLADLPLFDNVRAYAYSGSYPEVDSRAMSDYLAPALAIYKGKVYSLTEGASSSSVPLSDIIDAECALSGVLEAGDYDTSDLADTVRGYRVGSIGALRAAIEPLQGAYPFDVVQSGYVITFKRRGTAAVRTVFADDLDARPYDASPGAASTEVREMDTQLPARVTVSYLDVDREYDPGTQYADRLGTQSSNVTAIDLPIVLTAEEAARAAEVLIKMYWLERDALGPYALPPSYGDIEPGDVVSVAGRDVRVRDITYEQDGRVSIAGKPAGLFSRVYSSSAIGVTGTVVGKQLQLTGPSYGVLIDGPCLRSSMDSPGFLAAMCGLTEGWESGVLMRSTDSGQTWTNAQGFSGPVPIGYTTNAAAASVDPRVIDVTSRINVVMISGALASVTEQSMLNGANFFAYGAPGRWEIIAAQNCVLQGDGSYTLDTLLRGRFGSEWTMYLHSAADALVLLTDLDLAFVSQDINTINASIDWRAVTTGKPVASGADIEFSYSGENLRPLSPVHFNSARSRTSGDWTLSWTRRSRIGGEWIGGTTVPLAESAERYEIDIYFDQQYRFLRRTLYAESPTVTYDYDAQVSDYMLYLPIYAKIYQISATVGRGRPLEAVAVPDLYAYVGTLPDPAPLDDSVYAFFPVAALSSSWIAYATGFVSGEYRGRWWISSDGKAYTQQGADQAPLDIPSDAGSVGVNGSLWCAIPLGGRDGPARSRTLAKGSSLAAGTELALYADEVFDGHYPVAVSNDPGGAYRVLTEGNYIYTSLDGESWSLTGELSGAIPEVLDASNRDGIVILPRGPGQVMAWHTRILYTSSSAGVTGWTLGCAIKAQFWPSSGYAEDAYVVCIGKGAVWLALVTHAGEYKAIVSADNAITWTLAHTFTAGEGGADISKLTGPHFCGTDSFLYDASSARGFKRTSANAWTSFVCSGISTPDWRRSRGNGTLVQVIEQEAWGPRLYWSTDGQSFTACTGLHP